VELMEDRLLLITPNNSKFMEPNYSKLPIDRIIDDNFCI